MASGALGFPRSYFCEKTLPSRLISSHKYSDNALTTAGAKLLSLRNQGVEKFSVDKDGSVSANGIIQIAKAEVLYSNYAQTTIVTIPNGAIISDISIQVTIGFNDSDFASDGIEVGTTADPDHFYSEGVLGTMFADKSTLVSASFLPYGATASTNITFKYSGTNSDATQGTAYIYVYYTTF